MKVKTILFIATLLLPIFITPVESEPVNPGQIHGRWLLIYRGNYGYQFHFFKNYRALSVIYLNTSAVVFKGIYSMEDATTLRINIYEMKNSQPANINYYSGFVKTNSSYFLFKIKRYNESKTQFLEMEMIKIVIDGRSSEGYFEPVIKLKKS